MKNDYKKLILAVFSIMFVLMLVADVSAANNVSSCQPIFLPGEYSLANDISEITGLINCFGVDVDDVVFDCNGFTLLGNDLIYAFVIKNMTNITIKNCVFAEFDYGIYVESGSNVVFVNNAFSSNGYGIRIQNSSNVNITNNTIRDSAQFGILLSSSSGNIFYDNNFINRENVKLVGNIGTNFWNDTLVGNSWSQPNGAGYSQLCADLNNDTFCDSNYTIKENNTDYLPLKSYLLCYDDCGSESHGGKTEYKGVNYSAGEIDLKKGYNKDYLGGDKLNINLRGESHVFGVDKISTTFVRVNVSSTLQQALLFVGETKKFSLIPGWYNLNVTLNKITGTGSSAKANITLITIQEEILLEENLSQERICNESWLCGDWGECFEKRQTRFCMDLNGCSTQNDKPLIEQLCNLSKADKVLQNKFIYILLIILLVVFIVLFIRWIRKDIL